MLTFDRLKQIQAPQDTCKQFNKLIMFCDQLKFSLSLTGQNMIPMNLSTTNILTPSSFFTGALTSQISENFNSIDLFFVAESLTGLFPTPDITLKTVETGVKRYQASSQHLHIRLSVFTCPLKGVRNGRDEIYKNISCTSPTCSACLPETWDRPRPLRTTRSLHRSDPS